MGISLIAFNVIENNLESCCQNKLNLVDYRCRVLASKAIATKGITTALTKFYPANNGFLGAAERTFLMPGQQISRFGSNSGKFFSPTGTPLPMRALSPGANTGIHNTFKVLKPFEVQAGKIAPAFSQPGLGTQYLSPVSVDVLLNVE